MRCEVPAREFSDVRTDGGATPGAALARFLASWSGGRPVLLSLDDLHVADTATVEALADLAEWSASAPLLVVATFRPDDDDYGETGPGRVVLRPLSRDGVRDIATIYRRAWSDGEIDELLAETGGVPLAVHRVASEWAQEASRRQVHAAAERATEARVRLVATRGDLADGIEGLQRLIEQRQVQLAPVVADAATARVPYRGLEAFDADDADLFFGRDQLLAELVARVASAPIVIVVGASGSGKSSLVQAGLLPALATGVLWEAGTWSSTTVAPGAEPARALADARAAASPDHHVVVIDPLEELWTTCDDPAARADFCDTLVAMARDERFALVACVRADFVDRVSEHAALAALVSANTLFVPPMTADELRRVVGGPAQRTGLTVEPQLVEAVIADVEGRPGALPLLSTALLATWERRERRTMTLDAYRSAGGVASAMAAMADGCYDALTSTQQRAARRILLHLAGEENGVDVRRRVPLSTLGVDNDPDTRVALDALVARRLVIVDQAVAEVAHEALLRDWPRLARWLDEDRTGRRLHQQLATAAIAWNEGGRDPSELYRGARLQGAVDWADDHGDDLAQFEREFLDASQADAVRELEQAQTRARVETRRSRRLRFSLVGIAMLLVVALITGGLALRSRDDADATALRADANHLAGLGTSERDLDVAMLDAVEGVRLDDTDETRAGLLAAVQRAPRGLRIAWAPGAARAYLDPSGQTLAVEISGSPLGFPVGNDARLYRAGTLTPLRSFRTAPATAFLGDGRFATTSYDDGTDTFMVVVHESDGRRAVERFGPARGFPARLLVQPASGAVVSVSIPSGADPTLVVSSWDVGTPGPPRAETEFSWADTGGFPSIMLTPDSASLFVVRANQVFVLDPRTLAELRTLPGAPHDAVTGYRGGDLGALSADGARLATIDAQGQVIVRDPSSGDIESTVLRSPLPFTALAFDPSGRHLAVGREDGHISIWSVGDDGTDATLDVELTGQEAETAAMVFSPDGLDLWSTSLDGTIVRWDVAGTRSLYPRLDRFTTRVGSGRGDPGGFRFALVSSDGARVLYAFDNGIHERDLASGEVDTVIDYEAPDPLAAAMSKDGRLLYVASGDGRLRRFTVGNRVPQAVSEPVEDPRVAFIAVAPDGSVLVMLVKGMLRFTGDLRNRAGPLFNPDYLFMTLDPRGRYVAAMTLTARNGRALLFYDLRRREVVRRVEIPVPVGLISMAFDRRGQRVAVGYPDGSVRLVDRRNGSIVATSRAVANSSIDDLLFTRDALVLAARDGSVAFLDPRTLRERAIVRPVPGAALPGLEFLKPPGNTLAVRGDGTLIMAITQPVGAVASFDPGMGSLIAYACSFAGPDLPASHWREVLPDREHVKPCT